MADRFGSGLVAVIDKVALRIASLVFGQNLHAVLVRADRSVRAKTEEHGAGDAGRLDVEARVDREIRSADIVDDADSEAATRILILEVVEDGLGHRRREVF